MDSPIFFLKSSSIYDDYDSMLSLSLGYGGILSAPISLEMLLM